MASAFDRYSKQILFSRIGVSGQEKLSSSFVVVAGCGALGSVVSSILARAGVGKIRIIDRDFVEENNLQRQMLFDETDIKEMLPKVVAAKKHLEKVNSLIEIEARVADINFSNAEELLGGAGVIVDGLDNFETRLLINDFALKNNIPYVYGGAVGSSGMTMNIIPHRSPCFRCLLGGIPGPQPPITCDTVGVLASAPVTIGALEALEAIKILIGGMEINDKLIYIDLWNGIFHSFKVSPDPDCPACNGKYDFLEGREGIKTTILCGSDSVMVSGGKAWGSFEEIAERLSHLGNVNYNEFMLRFFAEGIEMTLFLDGRAIMKNTRDESFAKKLYAKYFGV